MHVINDILDFSKIEAGKIELEKIPFNLEFLINDCISIFTVLAKKKDLELVANLSPQTPHFLKGDPSRLRQIILNLLSNSFKFTQKGHIILEVQHESLDNMDQALLKFLVNDTGIGIAQEKIPKLFQSFSQADSSTTRQYGGTGLGLAISKQLVEMMGGDIEVESQVNQGTTFSFTAKFELADLEQNILAEQRKDRIKGYRLLIIDRHEIYTKFLTQHTSYWGMDVMRVKSIKEAYEALLLKKPDIIMLDLSFPNGKSFEFIERVKKHTRAKDVPIIGIKSIQDSDIKEKITNSSLVSVLEKPMTTRNIFNSIAKELKIKTYEELENKDSFIKKQKEALKIDLKVLVAEDNNVNQMVIKGLLNRYGITPTLVKNGVEACEAAMQTPRKFDLIFMDCEMPVLDGYSATRKIRDLEKKNKMEAIPIIALTAHALQEYRQKSLDIGMNDHLTKPIEPDELFSVLYRWQSRLKKGKQAINTA